MYLFICLVQKRLELIAQIENHIQDLRNNIINNEQSLELLQGFLNSYTVIENAREMAARSPNSATTDNILQDMIEKLNLSS